VQASTLVAFPGFAAGAIAVNEASRLLGAGALYRQEIGTWAGQRISALIGYRYLHASDKLSIPVTVTSLGFGFTLSDTDAFNARSDFHGVDLGLAGEWKQGPWSLEWRGKVALFSAFGPGTDSALLWSRRKNQDHCTSPLRSLVMASARSSHCANHACPTRAAASA
jgi:hypothetical protein